MKPVEGCDDAKSSMACVVGSAAGRHCARPGPDGLPRRLTHTPSLEPAFLPESLSTRPATPGELDAAPSRWTTAQVTIPRAIRDHLKLEVADTIDWQIEGGRVYVTPTEKPFLQYRGAIRVGPGDAKEDIREARARRAARYR